MTISCGKKRGKVNIGPRIHRKKRGRRQKIAQFCVTPREKKNEILNLKLMPTREGPGLFLKVVKE